MEVIYANDNHSTVFHEKEGVVYLTFPKLDAAGLTHGFSTRIGGVSKGYFSSMNLSFKRGDDEACVRENFRRIGRAIGFDPEDLVMSSQVHDTRIRVAGIKDKGDGFLRPTEENIDALITDEPGVPLLTGYADCVPLIFYDPIKGVTGMAHSGWRGTAARIGAKFVTFMEDRYGSNPEDVIAVIGPSICADCYEVGRDVAEVFEETFTPEEAAQILRPGAPEKYQLDLWKANEIILLGSGIRRENLDITDLCTSCNKDLLFSHRASHGKRGNAGCFVML